MSDLFQALAVRPELARTLAAHVRELSQGSVPQRTIELIALMVGWLNACEYCTCVHEEIARGLGVDESTLQELGSFATSDRFNDAERAALAATVALTREPRALPPAVQQALDAQYDEAGRIEVLAAIGLNNYLSRMSNALALRPPAGATPALG